MRGKQTIAEQREREETEGSVQRDVWCRGSKEYKVNKDRERVLKQGRCAP